MRTPPRREARGRRRGCEGTRARGCRGVGEGRRPRRPPEETPRERRDARRSTRGEIPNGRVGHRVGQGANAAAACRRRAATAKERESSRRVIAEWVAALRGACAQTVEIPRLSEFVRRGAKIMELSDASPRRAIREFARKLGETEERSEGGRKAAVSSIRPRPRRPSIAWPARSRIVVGVEKLERERDEAEETIAAQITSRAMPRFSQKGGGGTQSRVAKGETRLRVAMNVMRGERA